MDKKRIILFEFDGHTDILQSVIDLLESTPFEVFLFTNHSILKLLDQKKLEKVVVTVRHQSQSIEQLLELAKTYVTPQAILLFLTTFRHFKKYDELASKARSLSIIHNCHFYLGTSKFLCPDWRYYFRHLYHQWFIRAHQTAFNTNQNLTFVLSNEVREYFLSIAKNHSAPQVLPYLYSQDFARTKFHSKSSFTIVIPGGDGGRNRDYDYLLRWINNRSISDKSNMTIKLIFLGKVSGRRGQTLVSRIKRFGIPGISVESFESYLPNADYGKSIRQADILLCPVKPEVIYHGYFEFYGKSKVSGSIADAIRFEKKCMIPSFYPIGKQHAHLFLPYANFSEFCELLDSQVLGHSTMTDQDSSKITFSQCRDQFMGYLNMVLGQKRHIP